MPSYDLLFSGQDFAMKYCLSWPMLRRVIIRKFHVQFSLLIVILEVQFLSFKLQIHKHDWHHLTMMTEFHRLPKRNTSFLVKFNISQTITLAHCQSCNFIAIRDVFHLVSLTKPDLTITCLGQKLLSKPDISDLTKDRFGVKYSMAVIVYGFCFSAA